MVHIYLRLFYSSLKTYLISLKLLFLHPNLKKPPIKIFNLQTTIYHNTYLSSHLTTQNSQLTTIKQNTLKH